MSMSLTIHTIMDKEINDVFAEPYRIYILINGEIIDEDLISEFDVERQKFIKEWEAPNKTEVCGLGWTFSGIHYLLNEKEYLKDTHFPLNFLLSQDHIGFEIGWRPVNFFYSYEVKVISDALNNLNFDDLIEKYIPQQFNDLKIYRSPWRQEDGQILIDKLKETKEFVNRAAMNDLGLYMTCM